MDRAADRLGRIDILVNNAGIFPYGAVDSEGADQERSFTALGRYAAPEEIAATVAHLAGEGGRYNTGASVTVDGGFAA